MALAPRGSCGITLPMARARSFAGIFLALAAIGYIGGCTGASVGPPVDLAGEQDGDGVQPDWTRAAAYLDSLFDPQQSLCREYPGASTFWTAPDNALAGRALSYLATPASPDPTHGAEILARLQSLKDCACNDDPGHDGLSNHSIDPLVKKGAQIPLQPRSACKGTPRVVPPPASMCGDPGASCPAGAMVFSADHASFGWVAGYCQPSACATTAVVGWDAEGMGQGAADELALQILNRKNRGLDPMPLWQHLASKWDGQGLRDRAALTDGKYATANLALFKICARVLGQPLPAGVDRKLTEAQNAQGGFRTFYDLNGQFTLDQLGNAATTAQVILAFRKPIADF